MTCTNACQNISRALSQHNAALHGADGQVGIQRARISLKERRRKLANPTESIQLRFSCAVGENDGKELRSIRVRNDAPEGSLSR